MELILHRIPSQTYRFPTRQFRDVRKRSGFTNRTCQKQWLEKYEFLSYSTSCDGLFCLACVLFPDSSHRIAKKMISEPYHNWKDFSEDVKKHASHQYHLNSMLLLQNFVSTYNNPETRIDCTINEQNRIKIEKNRKILSSIVKIIVFCGRQGIPLRGHRDDDAVIREHGILNAGNFKELLKFRAEAGDTILADHLKHGNRNAMYTSKTFQEELLRCINEYIQMKIVEEISSQPIGPLFGIQVDAVTDAANKEQLGVVVRYVQRGIPREKLLEYIECQSGAGEQLCANILVVIERCGLSIRNCRSQTMDGAACMSGRNKGCAALLQKKAPSAVYNYCANHDLNLVLCKSCKVPEIATMLETLKQLGLFFKYSPKRSRLLKNCVQDYNDDPNHIDKISKSKFHVFCETRWVEKHLVLEDFDCMYEPLLDCLRNITLANGWDANSVLQASGLHENLTTALFIAAFHCTKRLFGFTRQLSICLQGSECDVFRGFELIDAVKTALKQERKDVDASFQRTYQKMKAMARKAGLDQLITPRTCNRQTLRSNVPYDTVEEYYKRAVYIPFLDGMVQEFDTRFTTLSVQAVSTMNFIPSKCSDLSENVIHKVFTRFKDDISLSYDLFQQEAKLWKVFWSDKSVKPSTMKDTLQHPSTSTSMFSCLTKIFHLLSLSSISAASVERSNSSVRLIKDRRRTTMGEERFNALLLLYEHKNIDIDTYKIVDTFSQKRPRKMLLINPLS